jgi:hypothetical protein
MENIFILPTSKPSRLGYYTDPKDTQLYILSNGNKIGDYKPNWKPQNIYITSGEEIKEGNWVIWFGKDNQPFLKKVIDERDSEWLLSSTYDMWVEKDKPKKIILTTDQDLIKDGVQAINDDFLEWIVKNPNCKFVKIESNKCLVKRGGCDCSEMDMGCQCLGYLIIIPKEEISTKLHIGEVVDESYPEAFRKEETLANFAEKKYLERLDNYQKSDFKDGVLEGAKWQQERMYTEEELLSFGKNCFYKGFDKAENDDANCYTAFREEIGGLFEPIKKE